MKETSKCLEYYLDSKVYNYEDVEKNRRLEKAYKNQYGKYKSTGIYKPY